MIAAVHPGRAKVRPPDTIFLPYQAKWIQDNSRLKLMQKSRQVGITWAMAYRRVEQTAMRDSAHDTWASSRDDLQAQLFLEDCKQFAGILQMAAEPLGEQVIDADDHTAYVLRFANGRQIHSMSSNPNAQAGKRGSRVLDEFALHPDPRRLYSIAYPGITWGGQLEIISTHRGTANLFNELCTEVKERGNPKGFSLHTVTLQDALNQGFLWKLQEKLPETDERQDMDEADYFNFIRKGCVDEEQFLQEFMCVPGDDAGAFLAYDEIAACEYPASEVWDLDLVEITGPLYVGVDIGRSHDLTVITVLERLGDVLHTRKLVTLRDMRFAEQEDILYGILSDDRVQRACIDASGLGMQFAERAQERFGKYRVEGIKFTAPMKEELAYPLRSAFEDRTIRIPFSAELRSDLRAIRKETTTAGNIRITADRGPGGHSDRFWALALAKHAAKQMTASFGVVSLMSGREAWT